MSPARPTQASRPRWGAARGDARLAFGNVLESPAVPAGAPVNLDLLDLLISVRHELSRDVIVRAARITGTDQDHASIRSHLDDAIELARQLPGNVAS